MGPNLRSPTDPIHADSLLNIHVGSRMTIGA